MAINRRLTSDQDFEEMIENHQKIRVFLDNQMIDLKQFFIQMNPPIHL